MLSRKVNRAWIAAPAIGMTLLGFAATSRANLSINPTFDSSITGDPNAAAIEAGINATIGRVENDIANNVTVNITFTEGGGLGGSETFYVQPTYASYVTQLGTQIKSADDVVAISSLPLSPAPVNGNASSSIDLTTPLARALGYSASATSDSTITLNTSIMNLSRTGPQNSGFYDLQAVAGHEIDEVLGGGGAGSEIGQSDSGSVIRPLDLYRYTANGVRSYSTSTSIAPYFSIDGGKTNFVGFNQAGGGSDYSDWGNGVTPAEGAGNTPPQMQDAFGTPGVDINIGANEIASLDVEGWTLTPAGLAAEAQVPEPATIGILAVGAVGLLARRRRRAV